MLKYGDLSSMKLACLVRPFTEEQNQHVVGGTESWAQLGHAYIFLTGLQDLLDLVAILLIL